MKLGDRVTVKKMRMGEDWTPEEVLIPATVVVVGEIHFSVKYDEPIPGTGIKGILPDQEYQIFPFHAIPEQVQFVVETRQRSAAIQEACGYQVEE